MPLVELYGNKSMNDLEYRNSFGTSNNVSKMFERHQESRERSERAIREAEERQAKEEFSRIFDH